MSSTWACLLSVDIVHLIWRRFDIARGRKLSCLLLGYMNIAGARWIHAKRPGKLVIGQFEISISHRFKWENAIIFRKYWTVSDSSYLGCILAKLHSALRSDSWLLITRETRRDGRDTDIRSDHTLTNSVFRWNVKWTIKDGYLERKPIRQTSIYSISHFVLWRDCLPLKNPILDGSIWGQRLCPIVCPRKITDFWFQVKLLLHSYDASIPTQRLCFNAAYKKVVAVRELLKRNLKNTFCCHWSPNDWLFQVHQAQLGFVK